MRIILNQTKKEKQCSVIISFNVYPIMLRCVALHCIALRSYLSRRHPRPPLLKQGKATAMAVKTAVVM